MGSFMCLVWLGLLGHLWLATPLHARTMYVSDVFEIVLRSEKEVAGRNVIKMLPTGTPVDRLVDRHGAVPVQDVGVVEARRSTEPELHPRRAHQPDGVGEEA